MLFEAELEQNLTMLKQELVTRTYKPKPLTTFILREPKTRKISKSDFRDRIIHHAIINIIEPIFEKTFITDSYANRRHKGTLKAIQRFDEFKRRASKNFTQPCYVLKADVRHYFDTVDHAILLSMISKRIKDALVLQLIKTILDNHQTTEQGKGMPLGNLTSQFFANIYLNELDQYVKHALKAKQYIRYVDDFVIFHPDRERLIQHKEEINRFLKERLALELHPDKSKVLPLTKGVSFLGVRIYHHHKLLRKKNIRKFERRFAEMKQDYKTELVTREKVIERFEGWLAYANHANTYKYRRELARQLNKAFPLTPTTTLTKPRQHERTARRIAESHFEYSPLKTLHLHKQGLTIAEIAVRRNIKEATIWEHFAKLIEHNQCSVYRVLSREKIATIRPHIRSEHDTLKAIKELLGNTPATYDEIACVLAHVKKQNKQQSIFQLIKWVQATRCRTRCPFAQRRTCKAKLEQLALRTPTLTMKQQAFLDFFNHHINICILPTDKR